MKILLIVLLIPIAKLLARMILKESGLSDKTISITLFPLIIINLVLSTLIPISKEIYIINLGVLNLKFMCDIYSYFFGILVNIVWLLTALYSYSYTQITIDKQKINNFFKYLSLTIFATFANAYAGDLWTLFFFYMLLILFTGPLIVQHPSEISKDALKTYFLTNFGTGSLIFLPVIIMTGCLIGGVEFSEQYQLSYLNKDSISAILLFLFILGISKNCIFPFHNWIIKTTIAPTPISGLLHSVAAVKSGSIALIKIAVYLFGLDYIRHLGESFFLLGWIFYICGFTALYAAYRAWKTTNVKHRFAYSTISQLSYIVTSIMTATPLSIIAASLHIISHSLCKMVLFYIAGIFSSIYHTNSTGDVAKIAPSIKGWVLCIAFCGASIIGFPLLPGSFGKDYMIISEFKTHHYAAMIFLIAGSIINILYIYPVVKAGFFTKNPERVEVRKVPLTMKFSILIGVGIAISMSIFIHPLINLFHLHEQF